MNLSSHDCIGKHCVTCSWVSGTALLEDNIFQEKILPADHHLREKRKSARGDIHVPIRYHIKGIKHSESVESLDISNTGIRLNIHKPVNVGTRIILDVQLPRDKKPMHIEGEVVWIAASARSDSFAECGVAFQDLKQLTKKDKLVYFMADRLCDLLNSMPKQLHAQPVESFKELKDAFRLIYKEYHTRGYCDHHPSGMHFSLYCLLPESRTFVLKSENRILGTISLIPDSPCGLPMENAFPNAVQGLRDKGRRVAEVSMLALNREAFRKKSFSLTDFHKLTGSFWLFKVMFDYARLAAGVTDLLIAVHPKHWDLYKYLSFKQLGRPAPYASAQGKPALPLRLDVQDFGKINAGRAMNRFFYERDLPADLLNQYFNWKSEAVYELLSDRQSFWQEISSPAFEFLREAYPDLDFAAPAGSAVNPFFQSNQ